jgi:hypothetical protein
LSWRRRFLSYNIFLDILSKQVSSFLTPIKLPPLFDTAIAAPLFDNNAAAAAAAPAAPAAARLTQLPPLFNDNDDAAAAATAAAHLTQMVYNPNNLGRRTYLHLLSHQQHIVYYLGCILSTDTIVGFTVIPQEILGTISFHLQEWDKGPGFLIDLGDTYQVIYNRRRAELFVCGFWIRCEQDNAFIDKIKSYIKLIPRDKTLPPIPTGIYLSSPLLLSPANDD